MRSVATVALALMVVMLFSAGVALGGEGNVSEKVKSEVQSAIQEFIDEETTMEGTFHVKDEKAKMTHKLLFDYIHSGVSKSGEGIYGACVNFNDPQDNAFDIDFVVRETPDGEMEVSDLKIHKINGEVQ